MKGGKTVIQNIYLAATTRSAGKSVVALGLIHSLRLAVSRIGYFKPIGQQYAKNGAVDDDVNLVHDVFIMQGDPADMNPFSLGEVQSLILDGKRDEIVARVSEAYERIKGSYEIILMEGIDYEGTLSAFEFDLNARIAKSFHASVLLVAEGYDKTVEEIITSIEICKQSFDNEKCDFLGVIINRVDAEVRDAFQSEIEEKLHKQDILLLGVLPFDLRIGSLRISEIAKNLGAEVIFGRFMNNLVADTKVAAMEVANMLEYLRENSLIITPADRDDVVIGTLMAHLSRNCPRIAGIILTGKGLKTHPNVLHLLAGLDGIHIPILKVETDTYTTALQVNALEPRIRAEDTEKLQRTFNLVDEFVNRDALLEKLRVQRTYKRTPEIFIYEMRKKARSNLKHIVLPEGNEERTLVAVSSILERQIAEITLLGNPEQIRQKALDLGVSVDGAKIIPIGADIEGIPHLEEFAARLFELRKHKGVTLDRARDLVQEPIYYGMMMLEAGQVDGLVGGAVHASRDIVRPAFEIIRTREGISRASSLFIMMLTDSVVIFADCAVNQNPTVEELADIAITTAGTAASLDLDPYVAMLSYSTAGSGIGPDVEKVTSAVELAVKKRPDLIIDGPMQFDAAFNPRIAQIKYPSSPVAGKASVFIFPDLDSGNNAYKAVQETSGASAIGPLLQGLNKPVNDLSRGCTAEDIVGVITVTAIQAQKND